MTIALSLRLVAVLLTGASIFSYGLFRVGRIEQRQGAQDRVTAVLKQLPRSALSP